MVSNIVLKGNKYSDKAIQFNENIQENCPRKDILPMNHNNFNQKLHLKKSRLPLNEYSKNVFLRFISNFLNSFELCIVWYNQDASKSSHYFHYRY